MADKIEFKSRQDCKVEKTLFVWTIFELKVTRYNARYSVPVLEPLSTGAGLARTTQ